MKVLLSIKPEYADKILSGEKKFEFRKAIFKREGIQTVIIYATMPVGKILSDDPALLWHQTSVFSGISKNFFDSYFSNRKKAYAIEVKAIRRYEVPQSLSDVKPGLKAPQSFAYV